MRRNHRSKKLWVVWLAVHMGFVVAYDFAESRENHRSEFAIRAAREEPWIETAMEREPSVDLARVMMDFVIQPQVLEKKRSGPLQTRECRRWQPKADETLIDFSSRFPDRGSLYQELFAKRDSPEDFYGQFFDCFCGRPLEAYVRTWGEPLGSLLLYVNSLMSVEETDAMLADLESREENRSLASGGRGWDFFHRAVLASLGSRRPGADDPEKIREVLDLFYGREGARWEVDGSNRAFFQKVYENTFID